MRPRLAALLGALWFVACAGAVPDDLGIRDGRLAACPPSPNCVFTGAPDSDHRIDPFVLLLPAAQAWTLAREAVEVLSGTAIVTFTDDYIHAESTTPLMRYVDDLELQLLADRGVIAVRSASRTGWSDMGTNRERVWKLRRQLAARGVVPQ